MQKVNDCEFGRLGPWAARPSTGGSRLRPRSPGSNPTYCVESKEGTLLGTLFRFGGSGGIRTHVPGTDNRISSAARYDHFDTLPYSVGFCGRLSVTGNSACRAFSPLTQTELYHISATCSSKNLRNCSASPEFRKFF